MTTEPSTEGIKPSAPMKQSVFNKPSWSNPQPIGDTDDFFHRSKQTYVDIAAEAERKRKRKLAKKQREQTQNESISGRAGKRRRVSDDSDDDDNSSSSDEDPYQNEKDVKLNLPESTSDSKASRSNPTEPTPLPKPLNERYEDVETAYKPAEEQKARPSMIIDLEEDSEDPETQDKDDDCQITAAKFSQPSVEDEFPASDEEFPELARKARDKARRTRLESDIACSNLAAPLMSEDRESFQRSQSILQSPSPPEAVIQILITSRIHNTNPLIVNRRVSQRLKDVRLAWCQRQGFAPEFIPTVFLTWRGKRVFDVTTCKSLGIAVDQYGNVLLKGQKDIMGEEDRQIHMEAMTDEILEEYKKAKRGVITGEEEENGEAEATTATEVSPMEQNKELQVRIILKAKGFEDFKLIVKPVSYTIDRSHSIYQSTDIFSSRFSYPRSSMLSE